MPFVPRNLGYKNEKEFWPDETMYFYTDSTSFHAPYFRTDNQKEIVLDKVKELPTKLGVSVSAFSIAINHIHLVFYLEKGSEMGRIK